MRDPENIGIFANPDMHVQFNNFWDMIKAAKGQHSLDKIITLKNNRFLYDEVVRRTQINCCSKDFTDSLIFRLERWLSVYGLMSLSGSVVISLSCHLVSPMDKSERLSHSGVEPPSHLLAMCRRRQRLPGVESS